MHPTARVTKVPPMRRALACAFLLLALPAQAAQARDPITPLRDVHRGLRCTARTVVQGTEIASFDVDVLDVVADADGSAARILVRVSGPAVDATGIAEGFSGSPVYCPDANGAIGNAGAISATIGQYGEDVGLVTPIEQMLGVPAVPPASMRSAPKLLRAARPLASPLMVSGLSPSLGRLVQRLSRGHARRVVAAPAGPLGTFPPQELVPGASLAVTLSSGAVTAGGIGTVTFRDGATVYGFGHGFDAAGRRALQLADAYVFTVVGNPLDTSEGFSYKLAAPGHPLGILTNDTPAAVVGTLGGRPRTIPLTVTVRDLDTGAKLQQRTNVVDENDVGNPAGEDLLSTIAPLAVAQGVTSAFDGAPARETGVLCLRARVRESKAPLRFCNRYVLNGSTSPDLPAPLAFLMGFDVQGGLQLIGGARFAALHVERVSAGVTIERGAKMAHILDVRGPHSVRPGQHVRIALRVRVDRGPIRTLHVPMRIPRDAFGGPQQLALHGSDIDIADSQTQDALSSLLELLGGLVRAPRGAESMRGVSRRYAAIARYDGIRAQLGPDRWRFYRDDALRIDGSASLPLRVVGSKRHGRHGGGPNLGRVFAELFG
jgi:hypothetical protein